MRSEFENAFPMPTHWIEFDEKANKYYCPYVADTTTSEYQSKWVVWQHRQTEVDELQKRVESALEQVEYFKSHLDSEQRGFAALILKELEQALNGEEQ